MAKTQRPLGYYKWFWQDYRADRNVQRMGYIARGLYRELLDECWVEGSLPNNPESLAELCDCPADVLANAWQVLSKCFDLVDGRLVSPVIESLRTEQDALRVKRQESGRLGGVAKSSNINDGLANASTCLPIASVCHIEEKRREEKRREKECVSSEADASSAGRSNDLPKLAGRRVSRKAKIESLDGYPDEAIEVVKTLMPEWPTKAEDRVIAFDPNKAAANLTVILAEAKSVTPELLIAAGRRYLLTEDAKYVSALHFFFGPGKTGKMPKWEEQVRAVNFERKADAGER